VKWFTCCLWIMAGVATLLSCATLPVPEQPQPSAPHAILEFPLSMRLLRIDDRQIDSLTHLGQLRVKPGQHTLYFMHLNAGVDGSADHAGQHAAPFTLDAHAGITYIFESKT
jgi:hypothetical protein